jgi:uncharacterized protein (TIGR02996 family)
MEDEVTWLHGIMLDPDCNVRRLAYADWLDERGGPGDEARAQFIRLQIDFDANQGTTDVIAIDSQLRHLMEDSSKWLGWPRFIPASVRFERGFPASLDCSAHELVESWTQSPILAPIESLRVHFSEVSVTWLQIQPSKPLFPLHTLILDCRTPMGGYLPIMLQRFGPMARLQRLEIHDEYFSDNDVIQLHPEPLFPAVRELDFSRCNLTDEGAEWLCVSAWVGRLTQLNLAGNRISPSRIAWLRNRFGAALVEDSSTEPTSEPA